MIHRIWFQLLAASLVGAGVGAFAGSFSRSKGAVTTGALIGGGLTAVGTSLYTFKNTQEAINASDPMSGSLVHQETIDVLMQDRSTAAVVGVSGLIALGWGAKRAWGR